MTKLSNAPWKALAGGIVLAATGIFFSGLLVSASATVFGGRVVAGNAAPLADACSSPSASSTAKPSSSASPSATSVVAARKAAATTTPSSSPSSSSKPSPSGSSSSGGLPSLPIPTLPTGSSGGGGCPSPSPSTSPTTPPGSQKVKSKVTIGYSGGKERFEGEVKSSESKCEKGRRVTVKKVRDGKDLKVGAATTDKKGNWKVVFPDANGKFYATVSKSETTVNDMTIVCKPARSETIKV